MDTNQDVLIVILNVAEHTPLIDLQDIACLACVSKSIFNKIDVGKYTTKACVIQCTINALHMQTRNVHNLCIKLPLFLTNVCKVQRYYGKLNYKKHIVQALDDYSTHDIHKILSGDENCDTAAMLTSVCEMIQITEKNDIPIYVMSLFLLAHCTRKILKKIQNEREARQQYISCLCKVASKLCIVFHNASCLREAITDFPYVFIERTLRSCNEARRALSNL